MQDSAFDALSGQQQLAAVRPKPKGAFMSALDFLDKPGQIVRNLLSGNVEGAGRQFVDALSAIPRALIPGDQSDWELSRPQDYIHGSDLAGVNRSEHPIGAVGADIVGDLATDPLTYLSFGALPLAAKLGKAAATAGEAASVAGKVGAAGEALSAADKVAQAAQAAKTAGEQAAMAANAGKAGMNGGVALRVPFTKLSTGYALEGQALDPLSMLGRGAQAAVAQLPQGAQRAINSGVQGIRAGLGWLDGSPKVAAAIQKGAATQHQTNAARTEQILSAMKGVDEQAAKDVYTLRGDVIQGDDGVWKPLGVPAPGDQPFITAEEQAGLHRQRAAATGWDADRQAKAVDAADKADAIWRSMWAEGNNDRRIFSQQGLDPEKYVPADYMPGVYEKPPATIDDEIAAATGSAIKAKKIITGQDRADYFNGTDVKPVTDARDLLMRSASMMGSLAKKARIAEELAGPAFVSLADDASRSGFKSFIESQKATDPDSYKLLDAAFNGMPPQQGLEKLIAQSNRWFKQSAVAGAVIPKVGSATRNAIGHPIQVFMSPEAGGPLQALQQTIATPQTFLNGIRQAGEKYAGRTIPGDSVMTAINDMRSAMAASGGRRSVAIQSLRDSGKPELAEALDNNVIDAGFVNADHQPDLLRSAILKGVSALGGGEKGADIAKRVLEAPGAMFGGSENYARTKTFLDLLDKEKAAGRTLGDAAENAAAGQRAAFYDYGTQTPAHRTAKTFVPFGGFQFGALKQQATGFSRNPYLHDVLGPLYGQGDTGPVPPFVAEQLRIPLGKGADNQDHYLSGLAQPTEVLNELPNPTGENLHEVSRDLERSLVSSSAPVLKSAYGLLTGKDPYFDTPYASYDRVPVAGNLGAAGRIYNAVAGTGFIQPVDALLHTLDRATDPRLSAGESALASLTGAHVLDVDPKQAVVQQLQEELQGNVNARPSNDFYSKDPDTQKLIAELHRAKAAAKKPKAKEQGKILPAAP